MATIPEIFVLELTKQCNNRCTYCYNIWRNPKSSSNNSCNDELATSEIFAIIDRLCKEIKVSTIVLSGGEPLLRSDLTDIIGYIRSRDIRVLLISNGTLFTDQLVDATLKGTTYELPLLSNRKEVHDEIVGQKGAWDSVVNSMMTIHAAGGNFSTVFVATKNNYKDLHATVLLAIMLGTSDILYKRVNIGAANSLSDNLFITPPMIEENLSTLNKLAEKYKIQISVDVVIEPCIIDISKYTNLNFGWCARAGSGAAFVISTDGTMRICEHSPTIIGNIKKQHLSDICNHPFIDTFKTALPDECAGCTYELKDLCKGGCKAAAEQVYGSIKFADPFVRMNR